MKIGFFLNVPMLNDDEIKNELEFIKANGIRHVEIVYDHPIHSDKLKSIKKFLNANRNFTTAVHAPFVYTDLIAACKSHRKYSFEEMKRSIVFAKNIGSIFLVFHTGNVTSYTESKPVNYDCMEKLVNFSNKNKITLAAENLFKKDGFKRHHLVTNTDVEHLLNKYPDMMLCLDTGHAMQAGVNIADFIEKFKKKLINIHIHDSDCKRAHMALGKGRLNVKKLFEKLENVDYENFISIETIGKEDILQSYNVIRNFI